MLTMSNKYRQQLSSFMVRHHRVLTCSLVRKPLSDASRVECPVLSYNVSTGAGCIKNLSPSLSFLSIAIEAQVVGEGLV